MRCVVVRSSEYAGQLEEPGVGSRAEGLPPLTADRRTERYALFRVIAGAGRIGSKQEQGGMDTPSPLALATGPNRA
jgi:hypothetical protein